LCPDGSCQCFVSEKEVEYDIGFERKLRHDLMFGDFGKCLFDLFCPPLFVLCPCLFISDDSVGVEKQNKSGKTKERSVVIEKKVKN